jgi:hypothetical protein
MTCCGLGLPRFARNDMIADWKRSLAGKCRRQNAQNKPNSGQPVGVPRRSVQTNQISRRRRRLTEETVQNEAKLGGTGVCGQRSLPCGTWLGRGVKRAKRTQSGGTGPGTMDSQGCREITPYGVTANGSRACETNPIGQRPRRRASALWERNYGVFGLERAVEKRSQFPAAPVPSRPAADWVRFAQLRLRRSACGVIIPPVQMHRRPQVRKTAVRSTAFRHKTA